MLKLYYFVSSGAAGKRPIVTLRDYTVSGNDLYGFVKRNELTFILAGFAVQNVFVNEGVVVLST